MKAHIDLAIPALTVKLCEEDRTRLDTIIDLLRGGTVLGTKEETQTLTESAKEEPKSAEPENNTPAEENTQEAPKTETKAVTLDELRSKVVQLVSAGKKDAARDIVNEYAPSVGAVPEDKRAELLSRLAALEG